MTAIFSPEAFYLLTAGLTFITMLWISNLALASMYGSFLVKRDTNVDWNTLLEEAQNKQQMEWEKTKDRGEDPFDAMHIVILPNFKENEAMLQETLENLGASPLALDRVRVVLAMESREGPVAKEKADRLIVKTNHLFADIFATYHPKDLPGEVAGKSSNTQWAYHESLKAYGSMLQGCDLSRVFVTVADADTLFHPQYLSALTYSGMNMTGHERSWSIWQPPVLLMRNLFTVPATTRASSTATLIFELSALSFQRIFPAFAYSSYSMTLALASHPEVDGWDVDVIAEDHHMFCKCYFAALWEQAHEAKEREAKRKSAKCFAAKDDGENKTIDIVPQVKVQPIFLPAVAYLVESDTYFSSMKARFDQARRHSQGVVELGYVLLQYMRLMQNTGLFGLPWRTHLAILSIVVKIHTLHITSTAQCFSLILSFLFTVLPGIVQWIFSGGISSLLSDTSLSIAERLSTGWGALGFAQQALAASLGQVSGVTVMYSLTCFVVIKDVVEGNYYQVLGRPNIVGAMPTVGEDDETAELNDSPRVEVAKTAETEAKDHAREAEGVVDSSSSSTSPVAGTPLESVVRGPYSFFGKVWLFSSLLHDTLSFGYITIAIYAMIPVCLAAWSLFRRGTDFEYIVAEKPVQA
jgi:cellulose synthase/poly-beta-1,6-N-acetylglucosamine synthase-like glycosyltransferase